MHSSARLGLDLLKVHAAGRSLAGMPKGYRFQRVPGQGLGFRGLGV